MQRLGDYTNALADFKRQRTLSRAITAWGRAELEGGGHRAQVHTLYGDATDKQAIIDIIERGAVVPSSNTTVTALNQTSVVDFVSLMGPGSAGAALFGRCLNVGFNGSYGVKVPGIVADGTAVVFIAPGAPIPVRQYSFDGPVLGPKKAALLVTYTRELLNASSADTMIRALLAEELSVGLDKLLFDSTETDGVRPSGLRFGIDPITATTGPPGVNSAGIMAFDLAKLASAIAPVANGSIVFVASPQCATAVNLLRTAPLPYPLLSSAGIEPGAILAVAVNALCVAGGNNPPRIEVSNKATLHMEQDTPLAITSAGPPSIASPVRSLFQTDTIGVRIIADINWAMRVATGGIAWTQGVSWAPGAPS